MNGSLKEMQFGGATIPHDVSHSEINVVNPRLSPDDIAADIGNVLLLSNCLPNSNVMRRLVRSLENCYKRPNRRFANICFRSLDFSHFKKALGIRIQ